MNDLGNRITRIPVPCWRRPRESVTPGSWQLPLSRGGPRNQELRAECLRHGEDFMR